MPSMKMERYTLLLNTMGTRTREGIQKGTPYTVAKTPMTIPPIKHNPLTTNFTQTWSSIQMRLRWNGSLGIGTDPCLLPVPEQLALIHVCNKLPSSLNQRACLS